MNAHRLSQVALAVVLLVSITLTVCGFVALAWGERGTYGMTLEWRRIAAEEPELAVAAVAPGSPAAQAGIAPGDRVAHFGTFADRILLTLQANLPLHSYVAVGQPVSFTIERGDALRRVQLAARPTPSENQPLWLYELRLAIYLLAALVVGALVAARPSAITWGFAVFVIFGMQALAEPLEFVGVAGSPAAFLATLIILYMLNVGGFVGLIVFATRFPRNSPPSWYLVVERVTFALAVVAALAICEANVGRLWGWPSLDPGYLEFTRALWLSLIAIFLLVVTFMRSRGADRIRLAWAIAGPSIGTLCIVADHWFYVQGFETWATAMGLFSSVAPFSMMYAILRHRVIDVRFPLAQTFAATIASAEPADGSKGDRRDLVRRAALLLSADLPLPETLAAFAAQLAAFVDTTSILIAIGNSDDARLEYNYEDGAGGRPDDPSIPSDCMTARVLRSGTSVLVRSAADWPATHLVSVGGKETRASESAMYVPVMFGGATVGAISVQSYSADAYTQDDLHLLESCALYLGARLYDERAKFAVGSQLPSADTDEQTGLRRAAVFDSMLEREWHQLAKNGTDISVLIADVDLFNAFIDAYGSAAADTCLRQVAGVVRSNAAAHDAVAARYGDDRFAMLLRGFGGDAAIAFAESVRSGVQALNVAHLGSSLGTLSISIGVASRVPEVEGDASGLVRQAQSELDAAKAAGRNRIGAPGHHTESAQAKRRAVVRTNLALPSTPLFGRTFEIAQVEEALAQWPVVTVAGQPGIGKTRVILEAGSRSMERYADGIWYVDLAHASDADSVAGIVASTLFAGIKGDVDLPRLTSLIGEKAALLVFDNAERLGADIERFAAEIVGLAPTVRVLLATRDPEPGGWVLRLGPLSIDEGVALYGDRAERAHGSGDRTDAARIVERLACIPLAIELAASFPDAPAKLLTGVVAPSEQVVTTLLEWTVESLGSDDASVLRRLAIFEGDFTTEAAIAVASADALSPEIAAAALEVLTQRSLMRTARGPARRFRLTKAAREYALANARSIDDIGAAADRHLKYFASYARSLTERKGALTFAEWSRLQRAELANYRVALRRSLHGTSNNELAAQIVRSLTGALETAFGRELADDLKNALQHRAPTTVEQAAFWLALSELTRPTAPTDSLRAARHAFELYRDAGDEIGAAYAAWQLAGAQVRARGRIEAQFESALRTALRTARAAGDRHLAVGLLRNVAYLCSENARHEDARNALRKAAELADRSDELMLAMLVGSTALEEHHAGDREESARLWRRAAALAEEASPAYSGLCLVNAGLSEILRGQAAAARVVLQRGLTLLRAVGHRYGLLVGLSHIARLAQEAGDPERAARICGFTETFLERGTVRSSTEQILHDALMENLRISLGYSALERERGRGLWMSLDDVIAEAYAA